MFTARFRVPGSLHRVSLVVYGSSGGCLELIQRGGCEQVRGRRTGSVRFRMNGLSGDLRSQSKLSIPLAAPQKNPNLPTPGRAAGQSSANVGGGPGQGSEGRKRRT